MKSTCSDKVLFYAQVALIRVMYYNYCTYLAALSAISFFIPVYCLFRKLIYREPFTLNVNHLFKRIGESSLMDSYLYNKDRLEEEIEDKRRDL